MKGYKTIIFNVIMGAAMILGVDEVTPDMANAVTNGLYAVWAIGNVMLRAITNTPIFKKE